MRAVLLAAGFATRLYPLTRDRAKPLLEVASRPVIDHLLDRVLAVPGLRDVVVVTNGRFRAQFDAWAAALPRALPAPLHVIDDGTTTDETKVGAIGDLRLAWDAAGGAAGEAVLVIAGDNLIEFALEPYVERQHELGTPLVLVREIPGEVPPGRYSEVTVDAAGRVTSFREKPADPRSPLSCICLYVFPADVRADLDRYLASGGNPDAPGHFLAWLAGRRPLHAMPLAGPWHDIGNLETLEAARRFFRPAGTGRDLPPGESTSR